MDDAKTHVTKYPYVGATCQVQLEDEGLVFLNIDLDGDDAKPAAEAKPKAEKKEAKKEESKEPAKEERETDPDAKPKDMNDDPACKKDMFKTKLYEPYEHRGHCMNPPLYPTMEHCPIDERVMLQDGRTKAVPYPKPGFNCNPYGIAAQTPH